MKPQDEALSVTQADEIFCDAVWRALKGDHNDLRKQQLILKAHRLSHSTPGDAEVRKALEPFAGLAHAILSEAPAWATEVLALTDSTGKRHAITLDQFRAVADALATPSGRAQGEVGPLNMLLWCPKCNAQHIDEPSEGWDNPPHRSHLCHDCGCIWRPADVPTNGVADIKTAGESDTWGWTGGDSLLPSLGKRLAATTQAWLPIKMAPKDGSEVLVFRDDAGVMLAREPTDEMCRAGASVWLGGTVHGMSEEWHERMRLTWRAMFDAAPPAQDQTKGVEP